MGRAAFELRPVFDCLLAELIYHIEDQIRGRSVDERLAVRREQSSQLVNAFGDWIEDHRARVSAKSPLGEALRYIFKLWNGLSGDVDASTTESGNVKHIDLLYFRKIL